MMLRTVKQKVGTPSDALECLLRVKIDHEIVKNYNPCALFRIIDNSLTNEVIKCCKKYNFKYINITEEDFDMNDLCADDNEYDVIINKFKITEGIDLKRCHVIYMDNKPKNESTVVQVIGRSRRNALFWRDDIDILNEKNKDLLSNTRTSYVFYNSEETIVKQNENGELSITLCDVISVESLKENAVIYVDNGQLNNGLYIMELKGKTGYYKINRDEATGFNYVDNYDFYKETIIKNNPLNNYIDLSFLDLNIKGVKFKDNINQLFLIPRVKKLSDSDRKRVYIQCIESYIKNHKINFDIEKYKDSISFHNLNEIISNSDWKNLLDEMKGILDYDDLKQYSINSYNDFEKKYVEFINNSIYKKIILDKINLFNPQYCCISSKVANYIDYIDMIDVDEFKSFEETINNIEYIEIIDKNTYIYSKHPFKKQLSKNKIKTFKKLKEEVEKNKDLFGYPYEKWVNYIENNKNIDQLINYDSCKYDLYKICEIGGIDVSKDYINRYLSNDFTIYTVNEMENEYIDVLPYDSKEKRYVRKARNYFIYYDDFIKGKYFNYEKVFNDFEISLIGCDTMKLVNGSYQEDSSVTSKISQYCKLSRFISHKYEKYLKMVENEYYSNENIFSFDKKCNSCLGFCVEYYAKYEIYGEGIFKKYINEEKNNLKDTQVSNDIIIVRACMAFYREEMKTVYGSGVSRVIPSISVDELIKDKYLDFVNTVILLGKRAANFIKKKMDIDNSYCNQLLYDCDLSVNHIKGLCDFINNDTIIDIKCTNEINKKYIMQVLSYYYLSTKRSDLNINRLIVYDAVADKSIEILIDDR